MREGDTTLGLHLAQGAQEERLGVAVERAVVGEVGLVRVRVRLRVRARV